MSHMDYSYMAYDQALLQQQDQRQQQHGQQQPPPPAHNGHGHATYASYDPASQIQDRYPLQPGMDQYSGQFVAPPTQTYAEDQQFTVAHGHQQPANPQYEPQYNGNYIYQPAGHDNYAGVDQPIYDLAQISPPTSQQPHAQSQHYAPQQQYQYAPPQTFQPTQEAISRQYQELQRAQQTFAGTYQLDQNTLNGRGPAYTSSDQASTNYHSPIASVPLDRRGSAYSAQDSYVHQQLSMQHLSLGDSPSEMSPYSSGTPVTRFPSHSSSSASPPVQSPPPHQPTPVQPAVTIPAAGAPITTTLPVASHATPKMTVSDELALRKMRSSSGLDGNGGPEFISFMRPHLDAYLAAPNRIAFGERAVIVMSSKVAQKSYGTEKRFLCPPPMAVFIGNSWWHEPREGGKLAPPHIVVSISGEPIPNEGTVEWSGADGSAFDPTIDVPDPSCTTFVGRAVGKQLYISEADEKRKKVDALVHVSAPKMGDEIERSIGVFKSRPIKVISKPSKKRQSAKNLELCINHGSTVALFHRLRAQTVSTKYLSVAGSGTSYKGSDGQPLHNTVNGSATSPQFAARTTSWDSFIIYIVDTKKPTSANTAAPLPPQADFPTPPANVIPFLQNGSPVPIYYNQTVVLQCLTSGVVSPTLIIRRVDHSTTVVGGGQELGAKNVSDSYCAPGEVWGDPVSQLHKIALEVFDVNKPVPEPGHTGRSGPFLACLGERVNTHAPDEARSWSMPPPTGPQSSPASHTPSLPGSPITASTPTSANAESSDDFPPSSDGGRVRRARRSSRDSGRAPNTAKNRRRQNSTGSNRGGSGNESGGGRDGAASSYSSGALWGIDVGETSIWTIVGTEHIRYNFYVPPVLFEPNLSDAVAAAMQRFKTPIPTREVTPFPDVVKCLAPDRAAELPKQHLAHASAQHPFREAQSRMLTLYGANFSREDPMCVFFGSEPSPMVEVRCSEVLACLPPDKPVPPHRPMLLVRSDGVVYPSNCSYP